MAINPRAVNGSMNYRLSDAPEEKPGQDLAVIADGQPPLQYDEASGTTQLELEDGNVVIAFGAPSAARKETEDFNDNLVEELGDPELTAISEKLMAGIEQDKQSREAWLVNMSNGISLLGLEIKAPAGSAVAAATPAEGTSVIDHPLLLEAVLRFQANAYGELLPVDGPVKVRNDGEGNTVASRLADALEKDMNHYLTKVAKEYYPDTDRMLLQLGFCGISFKKGYHDPIKRRPVIASIDAKDLIVSNAATDLDGAGRVTHRIMMRPSTLKRMQLLGAYRDIVLGTPGYVPIKNPVDAKIETIQGIAPPTYVDAAADQDRELYECYCELDISGFEHEIDGEVTGLPLPYKVTLDVESRKVLEIRRNWHEDDDFCLPRNRIIAYCFVPGLGFYGIGLLNILGNATKAVTAAWRLLIDAGMFSNFPGFLYIKSLAKQLTNQFRVAPGSGQPIDTVGNDIRASVMPLPYKDPSAVFIQLIDNIAVAAQRVGGTAELQVGEGKQDAPVGTTLAMIEQATKLMSAVHKRLHQAQGQEFDMLRSLLMEDPEALWRHNKKSAVLKALLHEGGQDSVAEEQEKAEERHRQTFLLALNDLTLTPAADPNTSSQTERYLKVVALRQMATTNPAIDMNAVDVRAMQVMGIDDPDSFFKPPQPKGADPMMMTAEATLIAAKARMTDAATKAQTAMPTLQLKAADIQSREKVAQLGVAKEVVIGQQNRQDKAQERAQNVKLKQGDRLHDIVKTQLGHHHSMGVAEQGHGFTQQASHHEHARGLEAGHAEHKRGLEAGHHEHQRGMQAKGVELMHAGQMQREKHAHERLIKGVDTKVRGVELSHETQHKQADREHETRQKAADRQNDVRMAKLKPKPAAKPKSAKPKAKK